MIAVSGMRLQNQDTQDENNYINPISDYVKYKCWDRLLNSGANKDKCNQLQPQT